MSLVQNLYCTFTKNRFYKEVNFKDINKSKVFLFAFPQSVTAAIDFLPALAGLLKVGRGTKIKLLIPIDQETIFKCMQSNAIEKFFYEPPIKTFNKTFKNLKTQLSNQAIDVMVDLSLVANSALAYLVEVRYRISINENAAYPFFNITLKTEDTKKILGFWSVVERDVLPLFPISKEEKKLLAARIGKQRNKPVLFVNGKINTVEWPQIKKSWTGSIVARTQQPEIKLEGCFDATGLDDQLVQLLSMCDAYYGADDELGHLARVFNKKIL